MISRIVIFLVIVFCNSFSVAQDSAELNSELEMEDSGLSTLEVPEQYKKENNGFLDLLFGGADSEKALEDALKTSPVESVDDEVEVIEGAEEGDFHNTAVLAIIDKTIGKKYLANVKVGSEYSAKKITVRPLSCWKPNQASITNESRSLIDVYSNNGGDGRPKRLFYGWVLATNPAASLLEHDEYDIILLNCRNN